VEEIAVTAEAVAASQETVVEAVEAMPEEARKVE